MSVAHHVAPSSRTTASCISETDSHRDMLKIDN